MIFAVDAIGGGSLGEARASIAAFTIGLILLCAAILAIVHLSRPQASQPRPPTPPPWVTISGESSNRDTLIFNAAVTDTLTNPAVAGELEFYGGQHIKTVLYAGFPAGFKPAVPGFRFEPWDRRSADQPTGGARPKQLLVGLGGCWIDRAPGTNEIGSFFFRPLTNGLILTVGNAGGGTVGSGWVSYEVERSGNDWRLRYAKCVDP